MSEPVSFLQNAAADRFLALASVFEEAGDYSAADVCNAWASRAAERSEFGRKLSAAIVEGVFADGS